jgi:hypothetical protein
LGAWLHASYLTPIGILLGAVLGLVMVFYQFGRSPDKGSDADATKHRSSGPDTPPGQSTDDRGETE